MNKYCLATIVNHEEITSGIWKMELAAFGPDCLQR